MSCEKAPRDSQRIPRRFLASVNRQKGKKRKSAKKKRAAKFPLNSRLFSLLSAQKNYYKFVNNVEYVISKK